MSQATIERYIDLLEKSFVVFRLRPYMTNKTKEVTKMKKIYFYDLGIRNSLLRAFQPIELRSDVGALWENYYILERRKNIAYDRSHLEVGEHLEKAYECKWQLQKYIPPKAFTGAYPGVSVELIHQENYFLSLVR